MTKRLQKLGFLMAAGLGLGSLSASAQNFYEPFTGTGAMSGYNGWAVHSGTGNPMTKVAGSLTYPGLATSTGDRVALAATDAEDVNKNFAAPVTSGVVYGSTLLNVVDASTLLPNTDVGNYFIHFQSGPGATPFVARVYIRAGSAANTFNIGILNNSTTPTATATEMYGANPVNYTAGQTHLIVFKHDLGTNTSSVWVNPTLGGAEPAAMMTHTGGAASTGVTGLAIRQSNSAGKGTGTIELDEVRAGSTFASVTPPAVSGVKDFAAANIGLFPNPTTGAIKLQLPASLASNGEVGLTVYSLEGKVVLQAEGNEQALNGQLTSKMSAAANGVYIVKIEANGQSFQTRIVKN